jgi:hypothetical protein
VSIFSLFFWIKEGFFGFLVFFLGVFSLFGMKEGFFGDFFLFMAREGPKGVESELGGVSHVCVEE